MAGVRMHGAGGAGGAGGKGGGGGSGDGGNGRGGNGRGMGGNNSGILPQFYEFAKNPTTTNQVNLQEALQTKLPGSTIFGGRSKQDRWARGHIQSAMQRAAINHANMAEQARWDTSESRHRRLASRHARILESHGHFAGLTGYNINPATQAVTDYASSRLGELGGFSIFFSVRSIFRNSWRSPPKAALTPDPRSYPVCHAKSGDKSCQHGGTSKMGYFGKSP